MFETRKVTSTDKSVLNTYIVCKFVVIYCWSRFYAWTFLFWAVNLTGNADPDSINILAMILVLMRVDIFGSGFGESIIIFGAGMSSSVHIDSKNIDILILGKGPRVIWYHTDCIEIIFYKLY